MAVTLNTPQIVPASNAPAASTPTISINKDGVSVDVDVHVKVNVDKAVAAEALAKLPDIALQIARGLSQEAGAQLARGLGAAVGFLAHQASQAAKADGESPDKPSLARQAIALPLDAMKLGARVLLGR